ncbi:MerR family transcriptional regulator [Modestobacter sp. VKM Ac-2983]|uniref:MerR family transcriptional regulator n=1 Tax=Modestobacter sp. VKM Ac-2983 TaxID=3004137 RepID=UPI0022AB660A|nr:MerR family transcriptional regulator [Modestobacter sp. VKM Ac-2983]MCZ2805744.1 MerR family transcriptional regulator [Modestobacter sp. VKM Ac-2983]
MTTEAIDDTDGMGLPIAAVAQQTGLSAHALRYYEKAGLVESVGRNSGGQRRYAATDLDWLSFLLRLRATGMSIADMQRFAQLRRSGPSTVAQRLELLREHAEAVQAHIDELQANLGHLDTKIDHYQGLLDNAVHGDPS